MLFISCSALYCILIKYKGNYKSSSKNSISCAFSIMVVKQDRSIKGMVTALDDAIGNLTNSLQQNGLMDNTIIIFTADVSFHSIASLLD